MWNQTSVSNAAGAFGAVARVDPNLARALDAGARFVVYPYCISLGIVSLRRASGVRMIAPGQGSIVGGLPFALVSLVFGWWGIPWGPIWTVQTIWSVLQGGTDVTNEVVSRIVLLGELAEPVTAKPRP